MSIISVTKPLPTPDLSPISRRHGADGVTQFTPNAILSISNLSEESKVSDERQKNLFHKKPKPKLDMGMVETILTPPIVTPNFQAASDHQKQKLR